MDTVARRIDNCTRVCPTCPFRSDKPVFLGLDHVTEIADSIVGGRRQECHETLTPDGSKIRGCAGALLVSDEEAQNEIIDPPPVFPSLEEWVRAHV